MDVKLILKDPKRYYIEIWTDRAQDWSHAPDEDYLLEVDSWLQQHKLGIRTSYNGFRLVGPEALTAFYLKYGAK